MSENSFHNAMVRLHKEKMLNIKPYSFCKNCLQYYYKHSNNKVGSFCSNCCILLINKHPIIHNLKDNSVMKVWKKRTESQCQNCFKPLVYGKRLWTVKQYACSYTCYTIFNKNVLSTLNMILCLCGMCKDIRLMIINYIEFPDFNYIPHEKQGNAYMYISRWGSEKNGQGKCAIIRSRFSNSECKCASHPYHPNIEDMDVIY